MQKNLIKTNLQFFLKIFYIIFPFIYQRYRNRNLFFTYIAEINFQGRAGGAFKYNLETGKVTDISPIVNPNGTVSADKEGQNKLLSRMAMILFLVL